MRLYFEPGLLTMLIVDVKGKKKKTTRWKRNESIKTTRMKSNCISKRIDKRAAARLLLLLFLFEKINEKNKALHQ